MLLRPLYGLCRSLSSTRTPGLHMKTWPSISVVQYTSRPTISPITNRDSAHVLAVSLQRKERLILMDELRRCEEEYQSREGAEEQISRAELWSVFTFHCVPFIGFGFLDNFIMIVAGEYIDATIGAVLGISTMAAAALGNLISDIAGVGSQGYIESIFMKMGMRSITLTPGQGQLFRTRATVMAGRAIGIAVGCFIGMFPLLFFNKEDEEEKEGKQD